MADPVLPIGHGPRLTAKGINYTQIVVERVTALDNNVYDVLFTTTGECVRCQSLESVCHVMTIDDGFYLIIQILAFKFVTMTLCLSDKGFLHKSVVYEGGSHIIEEVELLKNPQPIKTLLLSTREVRARFTIKRYAVY